MHNIDHLKRLIGTELEALVEEVDKLKKRVSELEFDKLRTVYTNKEFVGEWLQQQSNETPTVSCNTSAMI